ncbi:MAG: PKD domain-containing protein, partial [Terriglobales bacterium]
DLMNFEAEDQQPSIFFLKENDRQSILTVFNWTDQDRDRSINLTTAGLSAAGKYLVTDVLDDREMPAPAASVLAFRQPPHSVRVLKIVDTNIPAVAPTVTTDHPSNGSAGAKLRLAANSHGDDAVLSYHWDFGDGVTLEGREVNHTYTEPGEYKVHLMATGLSGLVAEDAFKVHISGYMPTTFDPQNIKRYQPAQ